MLEPLNDLHPWLPSLASLLALALAALLADLVLKRLVLRLVQLIVERTKLGWGEALLQCRVFDRLAQAVPALVVAAGIRLVPGLPDSLVRLVTSIAVAFVVLMLTLALSGALRAANRVYESQPVARERPLRGFVQVLQILVFIVGGVIIVAALLDRSPLLLLSGFGAMTAVLLIVFKDTLLGLVASVQLATSDMVRLGDWIEMPQYGANGFVIEVALHTIKIQNWDKTITTLPTYKLIQESFKNWRGMSESGGRQIKRSIALDQTSIRFLTDEDIERLRRIRLLCPYLDAKKAELAAHQANLAETASAVDRRRLTNVGTFRAYVQQYLEHHPGINQQMFVLARQLQPGPEGLPIELYCYSSDTAWAVYEGVQADIFEHLISILPEFGLRLFQRPSGADLAALPPPIAAAAAAAEPSAARRRA